MNWLEKLFAAAPGSIKGQVDLKELVKAINVGLGGGGVVAVVTAILTAIASGAPLIFPNALIAWVVTYALTFTASLLTKMSQGQKPIQVPAGATVQLAGTFVPSAEALAPYDHPAPPMPPPPVNVDPAHFA